jgi:hypothetical protein
MTIASGDPRPERVVHRTTRHLAVSYRHQRLAGAGLVRGLLPAYRLQPKFARLVCVTLLSETCYTLPTDRFDQRWQGSFGESASGLAGSPRLRLLARLVAMVRSADPQLSVEIVVAVLDNPPVVKDGSRYLLGTRLRSTVDQQSRTPSDRLAGHYGAAEGVNPLNGAPSPNGLARSCGAGPFLRHVMAYGTTDCGTRNGMVMGEVPTHATDRCALQAACCLCAGTHGSQCHNQ